MKFLIDECLHTSLIEVALDYGHEGWHVNWLGLSGTADWDLMPRILVDDYTFVTNNARDFLKLYARQSLHAGLVIILPQLPVRQQCLLFSALLDNLEPEAILINEVMEVDFDGHRLAVRRYGLPPSE